MQQCTRSVWRTLPRSVSCRQLLRRQSWSNCFNCTSKLVKGRNKERKPVRESRTAAEQKQRRREKKKSEAAMFWQERDEWLHAPRSALAIRRANSYPQCLSVLGRAPPLMSSCEPSLANFSPAKQRESERDGRRIPSLCFLCAGSAEAVCNDLMAVSVKIELPPSPPKKKKENEKRRLLDL